MTVGRRGRVLAMAWSSLLPLSADVAQADMVPVSTASQLIAAINNAAPGDVITLAPGIYDVSQSLLCDTAGTAAQPIVVRSGALGQSFIRFNAVEGFKVSGAALDVRESGRPRGLPTHSNCEHAFHVVGAADFTRISHCRLHDFNAMIKGNGEGTPFVFPDDVVIESSELFNSSARQTSNPVTPIDVVGGRRWVIRGNFIHDHAKGAGGSDQLRGVPQGQLAGWPLRA